MSDMTIARLALAIVDDLFANGHGQGGTRLVLVLEKDGKKTQDIGGWCRGAVYDRVVKQLKEGGE